MNRSSVVIAIAVIAAAGAGLWYLGRPAPASPGVVAFAQCLRDKGITMYGADWCPHCQNEKRAFGDAFSFVPYVECPKEPQRCIAEGIRGYPTWVFPDGRRLEGEQGLAGLSVASGCTLDRGGKEQ